MCGVPWHAAEAYISQLVEKGYKIAVCDQVEDPRTAKGLVKRAVTRVVTAGTAIEDANLEAKAHNYLGALFWSETSGAGGFAWMDVSTGAWSGLQSTKAAELWQWVLKLGPRELLFPDQAKPPLRSNSKAVFNWCGCPSAVTSSPSRLWRGCWPRRAWPRRGRWGSIDGPSWPRLAALLSPIWSRPRSRTPPTWPRSIPWMWAVISSWMR